MNFRNLITGTAVALAAVGAGLPAAQAQTLSVTLQPVTKTGGLYNYAYTVTPSTSPSFSPNELIFNFSDPTVQFVSTTPAAGDLTYSSGASNAALGLFVFDTGTLPAGTSEAFSFTSPDAQGSNALGTVAIQFLGASVAANQNLAGPVPAPEPGSLVSMAVLGACLGLGIVARRRKTLVN